jgi:serine protease Do
MTSATEDMMKTKCTFVFCALLATLLATSVPAQELPTFTRLAKDAGSAVVNIGTVRNIAPREQQPMQPFFGPFGDRGGTPFKEFFDQFEKFFNQPRQQRSLGSGFIITKDGFIVTNNHVIQGADEINVTLQEGQRTFSAEVIGTDPETDLALLRIKADRELPVLPFGNSDAMEVGDWVVAIGNPFGLQNTVTAGIVSAKGRVIGAGPYDHFIQTDASINPGNSGGPLVNLKGEVIGINTAIVATGQGIGFALPSNQARDVIGQLREKGKVTRGWLGVSIQDVDENTAKALGLQQPQGALVASVQPGEPAAKAGLRTGDVILALNGEPVKDSSALTRAIGMLKPGERVRLTVWRDGKRTELQAVLGERGPEKLAQQQQTTPRQAPAAPEAAVLGMDIRPLSQQEAQALGMERAQGLLVSAVAAGSPADQNGIGAGDVILEANGKPVTSVGALQTVLKEDASKKGVVMLLIRRNGQNVFRTIPLPN